MRVAAATLGVISAVTGCAGTTTPRDAPNTTAPAPAALNGVSPADVVAAIDAAGMPTPKAHDVTAVKCPKIQCLSAIESDTVSILKFEGTGPAQLYTGNISNAYQIEDLVITFASTVTSEQKAAYERVVKGVVA
jgi:hypothetical protein